jgi:dihydroorotate dehydrogenase
MEVLISRLRPYVQGFVWNPSSPNTPALKNLRTKELFKEHAELIRELTPK